ncbi:TonB-dependent receptor [Rhodanobacter sp. Col0626]|uniref:TonB-dependent receptor n=1 Tax=Rhodanobacter sp. Col0626 TaxID=3415679 RepID=UPI003CF75DCF
MADSMHAARRNKPRSRRAAAIMLVLFNTPLMAVAQTRSEVALEEVVVTARRTEEPLQKTPVAVTALTMDQLEARSAKDLRDIGRFTPNTYLTNTGGQSPDTIAMFIRGVGLADHLVTADPGVGLYVDGVYYARADGAVLDFIDVERVEVLRGPQGTLFGKNTAGGAINVISNPPDPDGGGLLSLTGGNVGQFEARGNASVPLGDNLTLGLSGLKKRRGCLARRMYDGACVGSIDRLSGRGYLRWTASPDLTVDVIADTTTGHSHMLPNHPAGYDPDQAFFATYNNLVGAGKIPGGIPYSDSTPGVNPDRFATSGRAPTEDPLHAYGVSVNVEYHIGDATLHSITAYRGVSSLAFENGGGGTGAIYDSAVSYSYRKSHWFSQELRVDGKTLTDRLAYVGGLYYFGESGQTNDSIGFFAPLQAGWVNFNRQETNSYAAFAHGSYSISDRLHVSAGIRFTHDTKDWSAKYAQFSNFASTTFDPNTQALALVRSRGAGIPNELNADATSTSPLRRRGTWSPITPRVGLDFQATPDLLLFASVARGSRSGGFNGRATSAIATTPYDPEFALTYEIGEKAEFLDKHVRINATAFFTNYEDLQETVATCIRLPNGECQIDSGGLAFAPFVTNAATANIHGGELELVVLGPKALRVEASAGYMHAKFTSVDPAATQATGLSTNSVVPFVPTWTGMLAAQYSMNFSRGSLTPRIDYTWRSAVAFNINPGPYGVQGSTGLINSTLTYIDPDDRWSVQLYVRNLTNKQYALWINEFSHVIGGPGGAVTVADPREYGLTVTRRF